MRKKKKEKLKEQRFWVNFCFYARLAPDIPEVPSHIPHLRCREAELCDEDIQKMVSLFQSVDLLDLDDNEITNTAVHHLSKLQSIKELRLKNCGLIDSGCLDDICNMKSLELIHLGGTLVELKDLKKLETLQSLKTILVSSDDNDESIKEQLQQLLPIFSTCEIIVNHRPQNYYMKSLFKLSS